MNNFISFFSGNGVNNPTTPFKMQAGTTVLNPGQPAIASATAPYVIVAPDASPVIGTHIYMGHSVGTSTQTASADGVADLYQPLSGSIQLLPAKVSSLIATQSLYEAYVLKNVLFDLTAGVYTIDPSVQSTTYGLTVMPLDVTIYPGVIAFIVRQSATYLN